MKFNIDKIVKDNTVLLLSNYYNQYHNVEKINIEKKDHYFIHSTVNMLGNVKECYIELDENMKIINHQCSCIWHEQSICPHIAATLLKINELDINSFPFVYISDKKEKVKSAIEQRRNEKKKRMLLARTQNSRKLINESKNAYQIEMKSVFQNEKYEITPSLVYSDEYKTFAFEYKIGNDKKYVLKNISDFLDWINNNVEHRYGKSLSFVHNEAAFDDFALKQIELMKYVFFYFEWLNDNYQDYYNLTRYLPILPRYIDIVFDLYYGIENDSFHFKKQNERIRLRLSEEEDVYIISYDRNDAYIGEKHVYNITNQEKCVLVERIELDEKGKTVEFLRMLVNEDLVVLKSEYQDFYKYVLSLIIDYIDIDLPEINQIGLYDSIRLYGDVEDSNTLFFQLYYYSEDGQRTYGFNKDIVTNYKQDIVEEYIKKYSNDINDHKIYMSLDNEKTYEFVNEGLEFLKQYCDVFVSEGLKKVGQKINYQLSVGVRITNNLLELDLQSAVIPKEEIIRVLEQYKRKKKFYRLKSGELLYLNSNGLDELNELMNQYHIDLSDVEDGHIELSQQRMFSIEEDAQQFEQIKIDRSQSFKDELQRFYSRNERDYPIPLHYENILRDYQKDGYIWMRTLYDYGFNGILADDMGLGKTLQVISLLDGLELSQPSIVVCPASLVYNWEDEVHKFSDTLNVKCIIGNLQDRQKIINDISNYSLLVTSYDYMRRDYELYEDIEFAYVILDEAQNIKNLKTKNAQSVKKLKAKHKLALTGTPIENSLAELWSIFDFLMPQYLFNYHYFRNQYENDIVKEKNQEKILQLKKLVSPFILRRNKKDVLTELPDKIEMTQSIPFNDEEHKIYISHLAQVNQEVKDLLQLDHVDKIAILAMLTKLRQICCEPRLLFDNINNVSSKMKACIDIISVLKENHQKVLLFSSFTKVLELLEDELKMQGISYYKLTGSTSKEDRRLLVSQFQNDDTDVFLISLKAGGTGLNLTSASAVIHYDPWWNMSAQNQATDRVYRIGQKNNVQVYKLVMKDSIEEKIVKLQEEKKELADLFVENNDVNISSMSNEDILELFSL